MADKFRRTAPLEITFSNGEQPTGSKLTALSTQYRNGLALVERALGDLWNQSGDPIMTSLPLQIPNLARFIGQAEYMNPALVFTEDDFEYTETIGRRFENQTEGRVLFPTKTATLLTIDNDPSSSFVTLQSSAAGVTEPGNYYFDADTGKFNTFTPLAADTRVTYTVAPNDSWKLGLETLPGVIPDPGQVTFTSLRVSQAGAVFYVHLPPRQPVDFSDRERPAIYPNILDLPFNQASSIATPYKYWSDSTTAIDDLGMEHYRYRLPKDLLDVYDSLAPGQEFPAGFLYLWDQVNETIIEDVIFKKPASSGLREYVIQVESALFDFSPLVTTDESEASYNSGLALITSGAPITRAIWTAMTSLLTHEHSHEDGTLTSPLSHNKLEDQNPPPAAFAGHTGTYPSDVPTWMKSNWANDEHTSLLSRAGSQGLAGANRDGNDNAMLGDLVLASEAEVSNNYLNTSGESRKLYFGERNNLTSAFLQGSSGAFYIKVGSLESSLDPVSVQFGSQFDHGFGLGSVENPIYVLLTVLDANGFEWRVNQATDTLTGGNTGYGIDVVGTMPDWVQEFRVYKSASTDFTGAEYWSNQTSISWGDYPGQTSTDGSSSPGDFGQPPHVLLSNNTSVRSLFNSGISTGDDSYFEAPTFFNDLATFNTGFDANADSRVDGFLFVGNDSGVVDPVGLITVGSLGDAILTLRAGSGSSSGIRFADAGSNVAGTISYNHSSDSMQFQRLFNTSFEILSNRDVSFKDNVFVADRVGIGVSSASVSLHVNGGIRASSGAPGASGVSNNGYAFNSPGDNDSGMFSTQDDEIVFYTNNIERLQLFGGNITIKGTSQQLLQDTRTVTYRYGPGGWRAFNPSAVSPPGGFQYGTLRILTGATGRNAFMPISLPPGGTIKEMRARVRVNGASGATTKLQIILIHGDMATSLGSLVGDVSFFASTASTSSGNQTITETQDHVIQTGDVYGLWASMFGSNVSTSIDLGMVEIDIETTYYSTHRTF